MDKPKSCKDGCPPFQTCDFCAGKPDDLVKRLREVELYPDPMLRGRIKEAADRIEELEAALRDVLDAWENSVVIAEVWRAIDTARSALKGEKDV